MSHTKGPWKVEGSFVYAPDEGGRTDKMTTQTFVASRNLEEQTANAHLIAAAPDMLEAHEDGPDLDWYADRLVNVYGESEGADFIMALRRKAAKARAAIKKARGEK